MWWSRLRALRRVPAPDPVRESFPWSLDISLSRSRPTVSPRAHTPSGESFNPPPHRPLQAMILTAMSAVCPQPSRGAENIIVLSAPNRAPFPVRSGPQAVVCEAGPRRPFLVKNMRCHVRRTVRRQDYKAVELGQALQQVA